jgi:hypothetical protein
MGVLSAVESAWTARFINAAGPDLEPREDAFPCLRLIEHIATRTTGVREAAMLGFSQHCGTGYEKRWTGSSLHVGPSSSPAGRYSRSRRIVRRLSQRADQVDRRLAQAPRQSPASIRTSTLAGPTEKTTFTIASRQ